MDGKIEINFRTNERVSYYPRGRINSLLRNDRNKWQEKKIVNSIESNRPEWIHVDETIEIEDENNRRKVEMRSPNKRNKEKWWREWKERGRCGCASAHG